MWMTQLSVREQAVAPLEMEAAGFSRGREARVSNPEFWNIKGFTPGVSGKLQGADGRSWKFSDLQEQRQSVFLELPCGNSASSLEEGPSMKLSSPPHFFGGYERGQLMACRMMEHETEIQLLNHVRVSGPSIHRHKKSLKEELWGCRPLRVQEYWKTNVACIHPLDVPLVLRKKIKLMLCTLFLEKSLQRKFCFYIGSSYNTARNFTDSFVTLKSREEKIP